MLSTIRGWREPRRDNEQVLASSGAGLAWANVHLLTPDELGENYSSVHSLGRQDTGLGPRSGMTSEGLSRRERSTPLAELLGEPDENSFGAPDVAEPIRVFVLDHFADELRAAFAEPGERIVDVLHGEHDA